MPKMTAMEAAVHVLRSEGVEVAFGVPGAAILPFYEALKDSGIRHVLVRHEEGGTHADESETSMMLYMSPGDVDMRKAVRDYHPGQGGLTRDSKKDGMTYSPSGVYGDPTLATVEKGRKLTEALVAVILSEIAQLRGAEPPPGRPSAAAAP